MFLAGVRLPRHPRLSTQDREQSEGRSENDSTEEGSKRVSAAKTTAKKTTAKAAPKPAVKKPAPSGNGKTTNGRPKFDHDKLKADLSGKQAAAEAKAKKSKAKGKREPQLEASIDNFDKLATQSAPHAPRGPQDRCREGHAARPHVPQVEVGRYDRRRRQRSKEVSANGSRRGFDSPAGLRLDQIGRS